MRLFKLFTLTAMVGFALSAAVPDAVSESQHTVEEALPNGR